MKERETLEAKSKLYSLLAVACHAAVDYDARESLNEIGTAALRYAAARMHAAGESDAATKLNRLATEEFP